MQKHLKYIDGTSDKFWEITAVGNTFTVRYGRNGTAGVSQSKTFDTPEKCLREAEKLVAEKIKKGYSETGEVNIGISDGATPSKDDDKKKIFTAFDALIRERKDTELLPFLQTHLKGRVGDFKKHLKAAKRYWIDYQDLSTDPDYAERGKNSWGNWGQRADILQQKMLTWAALAILDESELRGWSFDAELQEVLTDASSRAFLLWANPSWFNSHFLTLARSSQTWQLPTYALLRELERMGLVTFDAELFGRIAGARIVLYDYNRKKVSERTYIDTLLQDEVLVSRDIPLVLEYEAPLHTHSFRDNDTQPYDAFNFWTELFKKAIAQRQIEKHFIIQKCLENQTKEWNINLRAYYRRLLAALEPTSEELLAHQDIIFSLLQNSLPAIVNFGVDTLKNLYEHSGFKTLTFLEWTEPLMLRNDCKGTIKKLLVILEKIAKSQPALSARIAPLIADTFVIADLDLQERAAKTLLKIADKGDMPLREKLTLYAPQLLGTVPTAIADFIDPPSVLLESTAESYTYTPTLPRLLHTALTIPTTWNDMLYLFGTFISTQDMLSGEVLLNTFITQRHLFPPDYAVQLQPYVKQMQVWREISYAQAKLELFLATKSTDLLAELPKEDETKNYYYDAGNKTFRLINTLTSVANRKMNHASTLPLLCFPTHTPHWVAPKTLVERLIAYQAVGEVIDPVDMGIAISRMPREGVAEAIPLLAELSQPWRALLSFCLGITKSYELPNDATLTQWIHKFWKEPSANFPTLYAVAGRTYYPTRIFTALEKTNLREIPFVVTPLNGYLHFKECFYAWQDYHSKVMTRTTWYELRAQLPPHKNTPPAFIYGVDMFSRGDNTWQYHLSSAASVHYWHSLMPQNNDPLSLMLIMSNCRTADGSGKALKGFLDIVHRSEFLFSQYSMVVFAACFFQKEKIVRYQTSEVLLHLIQERRVEAAWLGRTLAWFVNHQYGIFQRMTETLLSTKDASALHNAALLQALDAFLAAFTLEKLPTHFKKLLEMYYDILIKTNTQPSAKVAAVLTTWKDTDSLKKIIGQILTK